jgi:hypothetical protein
MPMPLPQPKKNVPRNEVHTVVKLMLLDPNVGDVDCLEQPDHDYSVRPRPRIAAPVVTAGKVKKKTARKKS